MNSVRIDKWLWAARFFKTRSLASTAVERGQVRLNGERTKPAHNLIPGHALTIDNGASRWEVVVVALAEQRGPATAASGLYRETETSMAQRQALADQKKFFREPGTTLHGRPTKRDRRRLDRTRD